MSRRQSDEPEPYHRQWLHAAEAERTVPSDAMQVFRVYADWGARSDGHAVHISYVDMYRQTHMPHGRARNAIKWGIEHGWLTLLPNKAGERPVNGQSKYYDLTIGLPGEKRKPPPSPLRRSRSKTGAPADSAPDRYGSRSGSEDTDHYGDRNGPDHHYDTHSATTTTLIVEPLRPPKRRRHTSRTSLSPGCESLHAALSAVVPDVTERETELVIQTLDARPAVQSGNAVLPREIKDGNGPALVAEIRRRAAAGQRPAGIRDMCRRCSRTGHDAANCPDREPPPPQPSASPAPLADALEPCLAGQRCQRPLTPIDPASGYHPRCAAVASARASMAARVAIPAAGAVLAAEQVAEARALREATESEAVAS